MEINGHLHAPAAITPEKEFLLFFKSTVNFGIRSMDLPNERLTPVLDCGNG